MAPSGGDKRSPIAVGLELYSQIVSVALTMVLPAAAGYWMDSRFGTSPWLVVVGAALGLSGGMVQLLRGVGVAKRKAEDKHQGSDDKQR